MPNPDPETREHGRYTDLAFTMNKAEDIVKEARDSLLDEWGDEFVRDVDDEGELLVDRCHENAHACASALNEHFDEVAIVIGTIGDGPAEFETARDVVFDARHLHVWVEVLTDASPSGYIVCEPASELERSWGDVYFSCSRPEEYNTPRNGDRFLFEEWMTRDHIAGERLWDEFSDKATRV